MVVGGVNINAEYEPQSHLAIAQINLFNMKRSNTPSKSVHHGADQEPPLCTYVGRKIHTETPNKALIAMFNFLGLCPFYNQILRIEDQLAAAICQQYRLDGAVAPPPLQKGRFTMAATDNINHNSSSNTATTSMHQTSSSAIQVGPTDANQPKKGKILIPVVASDCDFSDTYAVVPWIDIQTTNIKVTKAREL